MTWQATPYPRYAPPSVSFANHWHKHCLDNVKLTLGSLIFGAKRIVNGGNDNVGMVLDCTLGDSSLAVYLTEDALAGLLDDVMTVETLRALDEPWRLTLIESALTPLVDTLQEQLGLALRLVQARQAEAPLPVDSLRFSIRSGGNAGPERSWFLAIVLADDPPTEVLEYLQRFGNTAAKDLSWLPLPVALEVGRTSLSLAEVALLTIGDIIMLCDAYYLSEKCLRINVSDQLSCIAKIDGNVLTLQTPFNNNTDNKMAYESTYSNTAEAQMPGTVNAEGKAEGNDNVQTDTENHLAELQVNLVFIAGRLQLTVGELRQMQPGHVFDLRQTADRHIDITANGAVIGTGELVEVDGRAGVRVHECK